MENNSFSDAPQFKQKFQNFDKIKLYRKDQFKEWVLNKLDYYENNLKKKDIEEVEKRLDFFSRFMDVIFQLSEEYPNRWKNLTEKLKKVSITKVKYTHQASHKERDVLKEELRQINAVVNLPNNLFNAIIRFIDNEPFELDDLIKEYISSLTDGKRPDIWPERLYNFVKETMRKKVC